MTDEAPPLAAVIGWPIAHSKSPILHSHWLKRYNIKGHYIPIGLRPQDFENGVRSLALLGFKGFNVTIPYKESILSLADSVSDRAALIGAANTIVLREGGLISADNTDGYGFVENIRTAYPDWSIRGKSVLLLGAGGASRAIISALLGEGAESIRIANRTRQRAEILREQFGARIEVTDWNRARDAADGVSMIVNTTSLGMEGRPPLLLDLSSAPIDALVTDIVYTPLETDLLLQARNRGMPTVDGLGMLLHQAVPGFHHWFDVRPEVDSDLRLAVLSA